MSPFPAQCGAWASLFLDVLEVQGINRNDDYLLVTASDHRGFIVNDWTFAGPGTGGVWTNVPGPAGIINAAGDGYSWASEEVTDQPGDPGQGNANPASLFGNHQFVRLDIGAPSAPNIVYYDPSYGVIYTGLDDFDNNHLAGFWDITATGNFEFVKNNTAALEVGADKGDYHEGRIAWHGLL